MNMSYGNELDKIYRKGKVKGFFQGVLMGLIGFFFLLVLVLILRLSYD